MNKLLCITGPTATGKTSLAVKIALHLNGEIISADSRQVYRGMDIGTGKDLREYTIGEKRIPYHLIDIVDAGYEYNLFEFQNDFLKAYKEITERGSLPVLCGGTGLYIESVVKGYSLKEVPVNNDYRKTLENKSNQELVEMLHNSREMHNTTDALIRERIIRALEIENCPGSEVPFPDISSMVFCMKLDKDQLYQRIYKRLIERIDEGMITEVQTLLNKGVPESMLEHYGLEYRFVLEHLRGDMSLKEMTDKLFIAIRQFAKRQRKWFQRMERNGTPIHWLDASMPQETLIEEVFFTWQNQ